MPFNFLENVLHVLIFLCFLCSPCCVFPFSTSIIQWKLLPCVALEKQRIVLAQALLWRGVWRKRGSTCGSALSRARQLQRSHSPADLQSNSQKPVPALRRSSPNNKSFPVFGVCVCVFLSVHDSGLPPRWGRLRPLSPYTVVFLLPDF